MDFYVVQLLLLLGLPSYSVTYPDRNLNPEIQERLLNQVIHAFPNDTTTLATKNQDTSISILDPVPIVLKDVTFHLFTISNPDNPYFLKVGDYENLSASPFDPKRPTKIIIHGWTDSIDTFWFYNFRRDYLSVGDYNVIGVNWFPLSGNEYFTAVKLTRQVGEYVGELLKFLQFGANLSIENVHILGHSLGAHIAGFAGDNVSGKVGRITGMDPARPGFEIPHVKDPKDRLDSTDAIFVDVIHTCIGTAGFVKPIGHADFYPNGGTNRQPGCSVLLSHYCSHTRSHQYMEESIVNPRGFVAAECESWKDFQAGKCSSNVHTVFMGEYINVNTRGIFYLETNVQSPFGKGVL